MRARAYLESSVWNRIVDRVDPDRRRLTRSFLRLGRRKLRWFASAAVNAELNRTPEPEVRRSLQRQVRKHRPRAVTMSTRAGRIFEDLIARGIGTPARAADMLHLALAIAGRMDYLVSWDERHLATARVDRMARAYCRERGYTEMRIGTPTEVARWVRFGAL
jgi:predicted nucleic acid-binding protein